MIIRHLLRRFLKLDPLEGDAGSGTGGGAVVDPGAAPAPAPAPAADIPGDEPAAAPAAPAAPGSMLEAIEQHFGQPRDALGRFTAAEAAAAAAAGQPGAAAPALATPGAQPQQPGVQQQPKPEDPLAMPEGLAPKAQQRFQQLANTVKERDQQIQQLDQQVSYVRETFQQHGISQDQFEQAAGIVGLINRGDHDGAAKALLGQLQQLSLMTGRNYLQAAEADPLAGHADLRQAVEGMQITEAHAMELARARQMQQTLAQQRQQAAQQQTQQAQQQAAQQREQQAVQQGTQAVDTFCREMAAKDLDYPAIEAKLLPELGNLLKGVPPQAWRGVIETQYRLLKQVAGSSRQQPPAAAGTVLRPTGAASPAAAPKTMFEAMWGGR